MKGSVVLFCMLAPTFAFGCAPSGVCFRLSDCATGSVCTAGACVSVSAASDAESLALTDQDGEVSASSGDDASTSADAPADSEASDETASDGAPDVADSAIPDDGD
jgi:hypothetical protein